MLKSPTGLSEIYWLGTIAAHKLTGPLQPYRT